MSISNFQTKIIFDIVFHTRCLLPPRSSPTGRRTCSGCPGARRTGCSTGRPGGPPARASGTVRSRISILSRSVCQQQQQQSLYQVTQHYLCTVSGCVDRRIQECPLLPASVRQGWRPRVPLQRRWPGRTSPSVGYIYNTVCYLYSFDIRSHCHWGRRCSLRSGAIFPGEQAGVWEGLSSLCCPRQKWIIWLIFYNVQVSLPEIRGWKYNVIIEIQKLRVANIYCVLFRQKITGCVSTLVISSASPPRWLARWTPCTTGESFQARRACPRDDFNWQLFLPGELSRL